MGSHAYVSYSLVRCIRPLKSFSVIAEVFLLRMRDNPAGCEARGPMDAAAPRWPARIKLHVVLRRMHLEQQREPVGVSATFRNVVALARKVASTDAAVLLIGESGTGKELFANFIHDQSRRSSSPFVHCPCSALTEGNLETEIFGEAGISHDDDIINSVGLLENANQGTCFLDEVTELPVALQAKLLRVMQDGIIRRNGSHLRNGRLDIRFVSASSVEPFDAIRSRRLRQDLYFRLNVFTIRIPPLRDRVEDIPVLANHFLYRLWRKHHRPGTPIPILGSAAIASMSARKWRGNVRELESVIERLVVMAQPGAVISPEDIPLDDTWSGPHADDHFEPAVSHDSYHEARDQMLARFEKDYISRLVARTSGNMSRAARIANIDRTTLYRMMERNGMRRDDETPA
jgi:DNA-binding NtrC family response regulator